MPSITETYIEYSNHTIQCNNNYRNATIILNILQEKYQNTIQL